MAHKPLSLEVPPIERRKRIPIRVIRALVKHIAEHFDPEQIILFGSHAYGKTEPWSDVDLLVVKNVPRDNEVETEIKIRRSLPSYSFGIDILVRSREVIEQRKALGDWFLREITSKGKVMYVRDGLRETEQHQPEHLPTETPRAASSGESQPMGESSLNPLTEEWISIAESDNDAAWRAMNPGGVPLTRVACFHAQQCAEKYLKAYLTERGIEFPRQHPLIPLMEKAVPGDHEFQTLEDDLGGLEGYAVATRYPGARITFEMAEEALAAAGRVRAFVRGKLGLS